MDLRNLPIDISPFERCNERRKRIEESLDVALSATKISEEQLGASEERNCENMYGAVPIPVGLAGPLQIIFSSNETGEIYLPLATTEAALVASVNRGCKALSQSGGVRIIASNNHGTTRSLSFKLPTTNYKLQTFQEKLERRFSEWKHVAESTSSHLKLLTHTVDIKDNYVFLTISCDTGEAMGMNMVTIAAQALGEWIEKNIGGTFVTVAGNVDSDKKPSKRTYEFGRGFEVVAEAVIPQSVIEEVLKTGAETLLEVARAKLEIGSQIAGAYGRNLHAANVIAAMFLATGQDAAHVVEGSMADTSVRITNYELRITTRIPAILVGVHGGGTGLPAQNQNLKLLQKFVTVLQPRKQLAESIAAAVLAGELSLLAAQASHTLAKAHSDLARGR